MKALKIILLTLLSLILLLFIAAAIALPILERQSHPKTDGEIRLPGLDGRVDVYRDSFGIPHIYATTQHDLFMAQGYVQAQDRFWQMDMWRHQATGRLSELLGKNTLEIDQYLQTLGWERVAQQELDMIDADTLAVLQSFADGVNAYMAEHKGAAASFEYTFLPIINPGYEPAPWEPIHTLAWPKAMAWDLAGNMDTEIDRAMLLKTLTPYDVDFLFPEYAFDRRPIIVPDPHLTGEARNPIETSPSLAGELFPLLSALSDQTTALNTLREGGFDGIGSNSWAISGDLTGTGMPLLANDPHLGAWLPSIWYEIGLHCTPKSDACPYDVTGFAFSSAPSIILGHNDRIAWSATNVGPDVMDLYIEKINPDNPDQYEVNGEWVDMELVPVTIRVAGGDDVQMTVRYTRHGPILSDVSLSDFNADAGIELPENYAIALRWTALEPGFTYRSFLKFNRAQNWDEFREAVRDYAVPAQNLVYADVDGNIGYQTPGWMPIRNPGHDGMLPVPGWTDDYEWQGYVAFEDLPFAFNPPGGYIVTANNAVVGPKYPYTLSRQWDYGYRAQTILDDILNAPSPIDIAYIQKMHGNNRDMNAERLVPILMDIPLSNQDPSAARGVLDGWDYQAHMDSAPAALFEVFWKNLLALTFRDNLPEFYWPGGNSYWFEVVGYMVDNPSHPWWDDQNTAEVEDRDLIFARAFGAAVEELEGLQGRDPARWNWGSLHVLNHTHDVMSNFPLINSLFNVGPYPTSGGSGIVNATGWSASREEDTYNVRTVPSMRMIVDLNDLQNSLTIHITGQSGHPGSPHYTDMTDLWRMIQYHPMHWDRDAVEADAEGHLVLTP
jgi:penicillin G amidase